jgi:hypothetical protein
VRKVLIGVIAVAAVLVPAEGAAACSCAFLKPKEKLRFAKAGLTARVVSKERVSGERPLAQVFRYRLRVGITVKRKLGKHLSIEASENGGICGFTWEEGKVVGAFLTGKPGSWETNLCLLERPKAIRRLARRQSEPKRAAARGGGTSARPSRAWAARRAEAGPAEMPQGPCPAAT